MAASEVELLATGKTEAQASQKGETPGYLEYDAPSYFASDSMAPAWLQGAMTDVFLFVSVHYNFWGVPCLALLWTLYRFGYGLLCVALVALYLPSFTNGAHQTAAGREWDLVRLSSMWNFTAHYLGRAFIVIPPHSDVDSAKVIREQELDKKKKYVFACHPHGIIVLSRVTTYGGNWEKLFPNLVARGKCSAFAIRALLSEGLMPTRSLSLLTC
ncbi:hypothetical protein BBJ28_00009587 [Nothophytophthora sp. Chile5]|nr:hypothetical protein BBJ28_00009587 [Nothophytophthora sp. Chile5]